MRNVAFSFSAFIIVILLLSCAGDQTTIDPTTPSIPPELSIQTSNTSGSRICWGIWDVIIDPDDGSVETVPIRGASFQANVVNFLQPPIVPVNLLTIQIDSGETNFSTGKVVCDVIINHPFLGTQFCGFDVMGIVMDNWSECSSPADPEIIASMPPSTLLQNPDGWTRWWNQPEFTTYGTLFGYIEGAKANPNWTSTHTLNAFKYFSDDLSAEDGFDPSPSARGFFSSIDPGVNIRRYNLQFFGAGGVQFHFKYAISASWVNPYNGTEPPYTADDFPITANMPEAYWIGLIDDGSTAYYENPTTYGGDLNLLIEVRDWQLDGELSTVPEEIQAITIESPTLFPAPIDLGLGSAEFVPGNPTAVRIPAFIEDVTPTGTDDQLILVTVKSAHPATYEPQIPDISGYDYPDGPLAAYAVFQAPIIGTATESGWPMYRRDFARAGRTSVVGPSTNNVKFTITVPSGGYMWIYAGLAVDSQQRAILRSNTGYLCCVEPNGELAWSCFISGGSCHSSPSVGPDDSVYVGNCHSELCHIDSNGELIWCKGYSYGILSGGIALQADSSVLFTTWNGYLVKVDSDGNELWAFEAPIICGGPAIGDDGTIYFASHAGRVYAIDQEGNQVWMTDCGSGDMGGAPALGPHGIYIGSNSGDFHCLDYDGNIKWTTPIGDQIRHCAAVGNDGKVYVGSWSHYLYCLDQITGDIEWSYETSDNIWCSGPLLDGAGHVYVPNSGGDVYCISTSGDLVWEYDTGAEIQCLSGAITDDGTLLIGNNAGVLYAFKDE